MRKIASFLILLVMMSCAGNAQNSSKEKKKNYEVVKTTEYDVLSAFEILEHLVSPFPLLHEAKATKLIASIPLKLWFSDAYWNDDNPYARHYHEFEPKQFDMLLDKAGWEIKQSEKWISPSNKIGIRPFLRKITPRYYIVYCERK